MKNLSKIFHLPKIEIKKFDGNVKNWINFWGQFRKIDEDADLPNEDKFQYLIQSTEDGTPARSLVESFPPSAENYKIAIDQLKNRFARDEILIEVYVRELLNLILNQQTSKEDPGMALSTLYDRLETQLRALGTLGVTSDKHAAMLLPLVESALPYELLKIWERNRASNNLKFNNELQGLLEFLKTEVEAEERVKLAQSSFTVPKSIDDKYTVETLHTESLKTKGKQKFSCIFCESNTHASQDYIKAQKMTLEQKKSIISKKRSCFSCLKQFHNFRTCKTTVKCIKCARKHFTLMCPDLHEKENKNRDLQKSESLENTLTTVASETLLQTINVRVISDNKRSMTPLQGNSDEVVDLDIVDSEFFKGRFRHIQNLRQMLRDRFRKEYLAELVNYGQRREDFVKVGDVVMVGSDNAKRINWPMGKSIEVYSGQDGIQRVDKKKVELPINDIQENLREDKEESTEQDKSEKVKKSRYGRTLKTPHRFTAT
uniref:Uncharacterized protein LOC114333522 n=1 Tax=Diabrotica virgifera virgifera TaxID=50390 RepID=A0A6P7G2D3_DIAVI